MDAHASKPARPSRKPLSKAFARWLVLSAVLWAVLLAPMSTAFAETRQPVAALRSANPRVDRPVRLPVAAPSRAKAIRAARALPDRAHHGQATEHATRPKVDPTIAAGSTSGERPQWKAPRTPQWTVDAHGRRSDRVNGYMAGTLEEVRSVFQKAGWTEGDVPSLASTARFVGAVVRSQTVKAANAVTKNRFGWKTPKADRQIQEMPISAQTHAGTVQAVAFQKENNPFGGRHHFRIFDTGAVHEDGRTVWAVAASRDTKVIFSVKDWRRFFLSHAVERNADHERDFVSLDALKTGQLKAATIHQGPSDVRGVKGVYSKDGDAFFLVVRPTSQAL